MMRSISTLRLLCFGLLLCALSGMRADAQINIEKMRKGERKPGGSGGFVFDFKARGGNVEVWEFGLEGQLALTRGQTSTLLIGQGELGWQDGERYSNEGLLHLRHVFQRRERIWPELFTQIDYNKARLLDFRGLAGGGLRLLLHRREGVQIWWGTAYMLEREEIEVDKALAADGTTTAHRWSNYLNLKIDIDERARGLVTAYVQPRFDDPRDVRLVGDARLEVELGGPLSLILSGNTRYDSEPPASVEKLDLRMGSGVKVKF